MICQVCGLKWSHDDRELASGGNDNQVCKLVTFPCFIPIFLYLLNLLVFTLLSEKNANQLFVWNQRSQHPVFKLTEHTAAVKAIAWSPHQHGLLASGGGTADQCIRFWNTKNGNMLNCVDTGSQVLIQV